MDKSVYENYVAFLKREAEPLLSNIREVFSVERLLRISEPLAWTEIYTDGKEVQYEMDVTKYNHNGNTILRASLDSWLSHDGKAPLGGLGVSASVSYEEYL